jgi:hypothetical protein
MHVLTFGASPEASNVPKRSCNDEEDDNKLMHSPQPSIAKKGEVADDNF